MANSEHLRILKEGVEVWNKWRQEHPEIQPDLTEADFRWIQRDLTGINCSNVNLSKANLEDVNASNANFRHACLSEAYLHKADFGEADLSDADLSNAVLEYAEFFSANLSNANLHGANLYMAEFIAAKLSGADLTWSDLDHAILNEADLQCANLSGSLMDHASFVDTNLNNANISDCSIYGISAWNVQLEGTVQFNLCISSPREPAITIDNLELAQFIYLLVNNKKIRDVIDTITSKIVLILGRFTPERKMVLDALRTELREHRYVPVLFDFEKLMNRDITETIATLAHLARFVIADITEAKSIPQELQVVVPNLPSVPVQPLLQAGAKEYSMFEHFTRYPWVLQTYRYTTTEQLQTSLKKNVIDPAERKAQELTKK